MVSSRKQDEFIEAMYRKMYPRLLSQAFNLLHSYSLAQEAVQEAFRIACEKPNEFMNSPKPEGWITNTLKFAILNINHNKIRIHKLMLASMTVDKSELSTPPDATVSLDAMYSDILDPQDYRLLKLVILERYSLLEAAEDLGIGLEACKKRVQRAKKKMKEKLMGSGK